MFSAAFGGIGRELSGGRPWPAETNFGVPRTPWVHAVARRRRKAHGRDGRPSEGRSRTSAAPFYVWMHTRSPPSHKR